jgi:hypothetical protein
MLNKALIFIKYNNAFTIIFVFCFFGFGITFAAVPDARDAVYSSKDTVTSIDNSLIVSVDLDNFNFNLKINSITEDEKDYYVIYSYQTFTLEDGIWRGKSIEKTLIVNKIVLDGKDLGLYVARELGENINYELSYLKRVQKLERERGESEKVITTEYSGLIGKLLDPREKVIEGYNPVIPVPIPVAEVIEEADPQAATIIIPFVEQKKNIVVSLPEITSTTTTEESTSSNDNTSSNASSTDTIESNTKVDSVESTAGPVVESKEQEKQEEKDTEKVIEFINKDEFIKEDESTNIPTPDPVSEIESIPDSAPTP